MSISSRTIEQGRFLGEYPDASSAASIGQRVGDTILIAGIQNYWNGTAWSDTGSGGGGNTDIEFSFPLTNDGLTMAHDNSLTFGDGVTDSPFSINVWVKVPDNSFNVFASKRNSGVDREYTFYQGSSNRLRFAVFDQSSNGKLEVLSDTSPLVVGQWHMITATYDGSSTIGGLNIYVDGINVNNTTSVQAGYVAMENLAHPVDIGIMTGNSSYDTTMDIYDFTMYDTELSTLDIASLLNFVDIDSVVSISFANTTSVSAGGTITDSSGNGNDAVNNSASAIDTSLDVPPGASGIGGVNLAPITLDQINDRVGVNNPLPTYPLEVMYEDGVGGLRVGDGSLTYGGNHIALISLKKEYSTDEVLIRGIHNEMRLLTDQSNNTINYIATIMLDGTGTYDLTNPNNQYDVVNFLAQLEGENANANVRNYFAYGVESPKDNGGGTEPMIATVENVYAFYTEDQTEGTVSNWAFYAAGDTKSKLNNLDLKGYIVFISTSNPNGSENSNGQIFKGSNDDILYKNDSGDTRSLVSKGTVFTQSSHGFLAANLPIPVYVNSGGTVLAANTSSSTTLPAFFITEILDTNNFMINTEGIFKYASHGYTVGEYYYLQDNGSYSTTPDVDFNEPVFYVISSDLLALK